MSFLDKIKTGCLAGWKHGLLPSVSAAQAILESGWGQSALAQYPNHNLFGIKASEDWTGKVVRLPTQEFCQGKMGIEVATFRKYDSWAASIVDHAVFFHQPIGDAGTMRQSLGRRLIARLVWRYKPQVMRQTPTMR